MLDGDDTQEENQHSTQDDRQTGKREDVEERSKDIKARTYHRHRPTGGMKRTIDGHRVVPAFHDFHHALLAIQHLAAQGVKVGVSGCHGPLKDSNLLGNGGRIFAIYCQISVRMQQIMTGGIEQNTIGMLVGLDVLNDAQHGILLFRFRKRGVAHQHSFGLADLLGKLQLGKHHRFLLHQVFLEIDIHQQTHDKNPDNNAQNRQTQPDSNSMPWRETVNKLSIIEVVIHKLAKDFVQK